MQKNPSDRKADVLSEQELTKFIKKIKFQQEVNYYYRELESESIIIPEIMKSCTLFGSSQQKMAIVEFVLAQSNFDLGIALTLNLKLSFSLIFCNLISTLVSNEEFKKVKSLLQTIQVLFFFKQNFSHYFFIFKKIECHFESR